MAVNISSKLITKDCGTIDHESSGILINILTQGCFVARRDPYKQLEVNYSFIKTYGS